MDRLLDAVAAVACVMSPDKVDAIASRIRRTDVTKAASVLNGVVGTPIATGLIERLIDAWQSAAVGADELASMLLAARHAATKVVAEQSTELVWTGPTSPFVSSRRTEQALLQVINTADRTLFITSFVAYDISSIVKALNDANARGVEISMLLELSQEHGGSISFDAIGKMKVLVPSARLYAWRNKGDEFSEGCVHAKVAVADEKICFITSANLTGFAMERNMEAGLLIVGGPVPHLLERHLQGLVNIDVVAPI